MKGKMEEELQICHYQVIGAEFKEDVLHELREYSKEQFKHPYLATCKGNAEIVLYSLPFRDKTLIYPLRDFFVSFVDCKIEFDTRKLTELAVEYMGEMG